ncbi:quinolinate synthetase [Pontibacillus chungwhensis BH030062]|uniref:Quinolinate synthase n=1 Tax=Pontibacillus chungwhensis BH030062 TaxID=1385513 RepID=A0A0A2UXB3_9BACI|nr:quinolinate synthase NadA [Pontibacillus chungwhensis]KGP92584.1 quinolinate synthetase [Pontibacillus chungwhensis BH030062]
MNIFEAVEKKHPLLPDTYKQMTREELENRVRDVKKRMGDRLYLPGHHYQKDEVIQFADARGDSLKLAQLSADNKDAEAIVFCGVHFMAETADILTESNQHVYLPDMRAGCSMADMANLNQTEKAWSKLRDLFKDTILPLTYVNSTAAIKAFVGKYGGATVTSSNAQSMVEWAFTQKERILFLPDQHLGRNTAFDLGIPLEQMAVWDPITEQLLYEGQLEDVLVILWKGHCSVHENFTVQNIEHLRETKPDMKIIVHPECRREVVARSDDAGSTNHIIQTIEASPSGSSWAIGTEMNLVNRIIQEHPDKNIISLNPNMCPCLTMNRIDLPHLAWCLEAIESGEPHNLIKVDRDIAEYAKDALDRMLSRA